MVVLSIVSRKTVTSTFQLANRSRLNIGLSGAFLDFKLDFSTTPKINDENQGKSNGIKLPEEPQNCCMSGCANCVWVAYAEELAKILDDGGETAKKKIMEQVKDPNLRAFLMLELQHLFKENK